MQDSRFPLYSFKSLCLFKVSAHTHTHLHMHPDAAALMGIPGFPGGCNKSLTLNSISFSCVLFLNHLTWF